MGFAKHILGGMCPKLNALCKITQAKKQKPCIGKMICRSCEYRAKSVCTNVYTERMHTKMAKKIQT